MAKPILAKLNQIEQNLKDLLEEQPKLKKMENRRLLIWEYWKQYDGIVWGISKENWLFRLTYPDYITRALRKVMSKCKEVDNPERYNDERAFLEELKK